jgi:hypothetical protein
LLISKYTQPLPSNAFDNKYVSTEPLGEQQTVFPTRSVPICYKQGTSLEVSQLLKRYVGYSPDSNEVRAEAEESPLLEAVTRERLVKTRQTETT